MVQPFNNETPWRSLKSLHTYLQDMVRGRLWAKVLVGMVLGVVLGILLGPDAALIQVDTAASITNWVALPGRLFWRWCK